MLNQRRYQALLLLAEARPSASLDVSAAQQANTFKDYIKTQEKGLVVADTRRYGNLVSVLVHENARPKGGGWYPFEDLKNTTEHFALRVIAKEVTTVISSLQYPAMQSSKWEDPDWMNISNQVDRTTRRETFVDMNALQALFQLNMLQNEA